MKKNLTTLTGIVLFIAILAAGGCDKGSKKGKSTTDVNNKIQLIDVTIYLEAINDNGNYHLKMYNSYDQNNPEIDDLITEVKPGTIVTWDLVNNSGISEIMRIIPLTKKGKIMKKDAKPVPETNKHEYKVPSNAPVPSEKEKYLILFKDMDGHPHLIDPYLKIPKETSKN